MVAESQEPQSLNLDLLIKHAAVQPYKPAGKAKEYCNLCKRPVDNHAHDGVVLTDPDEIEAQERYLKAEVNKVSLVRQMARYGREPIREAERLQRTELILDTLLQLLCTNWERLDIETGVLESISTFYEQMLLQLKEEATQRQLGVQNHGKLLGPLGQPMN